jgi:phosphohistidine phosphatase
LAEYYLNFSQNIPTCGIVEIAFECDKWADIEHKNAKLISFDYPKKSES